MHGCVTFIIAQRLTSIRHADLILVVEHGEIVERGVHDEMITGSGPYREIYREQMEDQERLRAEVYAQEIEEQARGQQR